LHILRLPTRIALRRLHLRLKFTHLWSAAACLSRAKWRGRRFSSTRLGAPVFAFAVIGLLFCAACNSGKTVIPPPVSAGPPPPTPITVSAADTAPPPSQTGGFDGQAAYDFTAKLVSFGPRPPASDAIHKTQDYIESQLKSFGCAADEDAFNAQTGLGTLAMKNIVAKIPGTGQGIILLMTHYDTKRVDNFVGAEDAGSSSGLMLEMARLLCSKPKQPNSVWIAFLDGEETQATFDWSDTDSLYGSRELAASMAVSGDLKRIKAVILADMVGQKNLHILRDSSAPKWLTDLIWRTADRLSYQDVFVSQATSTEDDHVPFLRRGVPAIDIIDLANYQREGYWHTPQDTMDKLSPRSLAIVGHVILESVAELQRR
jgi:glutaminyl-peptide cyclotransferase